jgi:hypothetical protein
MFISHVLCLAFGVRMASIIWGSQNSIHFKDRLFRSIMDLPNTQNGVILEAIEKINTKINANKDTLWNERDDLVIESFYDKNISFVFPNFSIIYLMV